MKAAGTVDVAQLVREAFAAAKGAGLTGWRLEHRAAKEVIARLGDCTAERLVEAGDAFRAVVWPETRPDQGQG